MPAVVALVAALIVGSIAFIGGRTPHPSPSTRLEPSVISSPSSTHQGFPISTASDSAVLGITASTPSISPTPAPSIKPTPTLKPSPVSSPKIASPKPTPVMKIYTAPTPVPIQQNATYSCNCSKTCPNLSCAEAQFQLKSCGCSIRDKDKDGIACDDQCQ